MRRMFTAAYMHLFVEIVRMGLSIDISIYLRCTSEDVAVHRLGVKLPHCNKISIC